MKLLCWCSEVLKGAIYQLPKFVVWFTFVPQLALQLPPFTVNKPLNLLKKICMHFGHFFILGWPKSKENLLTIGYKMMFVSHPFGG